MCPYSSLAPLSPPTSRHLIACVLGRAHTICAHTICRRQRTKTLAQCAQEVRGLGCETCGRCRERVSGLE